METMNLLKASQDTQELLRTRMQNQAFTQGLKNSGTLGKDDFLKLLITQLTHQDPTQPMNDREFIAQMAQFSTLEQMTNMNGEFGKVSQLLTSNQALNLLGKEVVVSSNGSNVQGIVDEVTGGDYPQLLIQGKYYDYASVQKVKNGGNKP